MRICDVLLRNLIEVSVNLDHKNIIGKKAQTNNCVNELVTCIRNCRVSFSIWENKVKDGRGDCLKNLEWTSPTGSDFKQTVACIANTFANCKLHKDSIKRKGYCCLEKLWNYLQYFKLVVPIYVRGWFFFWTCS